MEINSILSSMTPQAISTFKQATTQVAATVAVAKKGLDAQKAVGEALIKAMQEMGKGINLDVLI